MDKVDMIFELLTSLNDKQDKQSEVLTRVEADLKYHIKRTDIIEDHLHRKMYRPTLKQVAAAISIIATLVGLAVTLQVI